MAEATLSPCRNGHPDCFALKKGEVCAALASTYFPDGDCPFYATKAQHEAAQARSVRRLIAIGMPELVNYTAYKQGRNSERR